MLNADKGLHGTFLVKAAQGKTCQHGAIVEGGAFVHGKRKQSPMELASRPTGDCNIVGGSGVKGRRPPLLSTSLPRSSERQTRHGFDDESGQEVKPMSWLDEGPPM